MVLTIARWIITGRRSFPSAAMYRNSKLTRQMEVNLDRSSMFPRGP